jgi:hypothetical protein
VFCPCRSAPTTTNSVLPLPVVTGRPPTTTQQKKPPLGLKSFESDHEIIQNGIICLKKYRYSCNPGQNPAQYNLISAMINYSNFFRAKTKVYWTKHLTIPNKSKPSRLHHCTMLYNFRYCHLWGVTWELNYLPKLFEIISLFQTWTIFCVFYLYFPCPWNLWKQKMRQSCFNGISWKQSTKFTEIIFSTNPWKYSSLHHFIHHASFST